jgi:integrase
VDATSENEKIAKEAYQRERAVALVQTSGDRSEIWVVLNAWLDWLIRRPRNPVAPNTYERHRRVIQSFIDLHGRVIARELRARHIEDWLQKMQQPYPHPVHGHSTRWDEGSIKLALGTMRTAFKWALGRGLLTANPFAAPDAQALQSPSIVYTGKRKAIEEWEHEAFLRLALKRSSKDWAILLMLLYDTGARPSELIEAKAEEWDDERKAFVISCIDPANKGRFKLMRLKKDRVVYVPDDLVPFVRLLIEKYKGRTLANRAGQRVTPLFRKEKGKHAGLPMTIGSVNAHLTSSRKKVNKDAGREVVRNGVQAYAHRHAYVTRWIVAGGDIKVLAELLGTSVLMIERHYSHLFKKHDVLRQHLNEFQAGERASGARTPSAAGPEDAVPSPEPWAVQ